MNERNDEYIAQVREVMPKTKHLSTVIRAFLTGGIICTVGQGLFDLYSYLLPKTAEDILKSWVTVTLIFVTAVLTGFGVYDKIGKFGGAGSIVPITGFANSVVSSALEYRREGVILGLCANMFTIAGPVLVFGLSSSVLVGIIACIFPGWFV